MLIIQSILIMEERASLKSYGRFDHGQQQMFYELLLTEKQYLLKYYNEAGKLKLIRPIKFPTDEVEIHNASHFLFCYMHSPHNPADSEIFTIRLDNCLLDIASCKFHLQYKNEENKAITHIYFNQRLGAFIFSDEKQNLYLLLQEYQHYKCKKIHNNSTVITRIQTDSNCNIVVSTEQREVKVLQMDWQKKEVVRQIAKRDEVDYYYQNGYEVRLYDDNPEDTTPDKLINLEIKEAGEFKYMMKKDSDLIFYSNQKDFFIVFDKRHNIFVVLIEGIFKTYGEEKNDKPIPYNLQNHNFTITFKKDQFKNIIIQLKIYNELIAQFITHQYHFSQMGERLVNSSFLKKYLDKIFGFNGLIDPLHQDTVSKAIKELEDNFSDFEKSRYSDQVPATDNFLDLSYRLMRIGLTYFPKQMQKLVQKVKNHIQHVRQIFCIVETRRLFQYCEMIQGEIAIDLQNLYSNRDRLQRNGETLSSFDIQKQNTMINTQANLLVNMINFLVLLLNELEVQLTSARQQQQGHHQHSHSVEHLEADMNYYHEVRDSAKSLYLISRLLADQEIHLKISEQFGKLVSKKYQNNSIWNKHHQSLCIMEYPPLFLHEHFRKISYLTQEENMRPDFSQFFGYLLLNRKNFLQIAYFYQYILKIASVPFLDTDISDLLQNILIHVRTIPEPLSVKEAMDEQNDERLRIKSLLNKMAGTAIKSKQFSIIKYLIQLSIAYQAFPLATMLVNSGAFTLGNEDPLSHKQHIFMIKSLLLTGKFSKAYLYVLENYSKALFSDFVHWAKVNGNKEDLLHYRLEDKILKEDEPLIDSPQFQLSLSSIESLIV